MSGTTATFATTALSGYELLADPQFNKGTAFSETEREAFDLHGLLPPNVATLDEQVSRRLSLTAALNSIGHDQSFYKPVATCAVTRSISA
jgi:hypothetical protein